MEISDQQLINQYLQGDKQALEILVKRYLRSVYGLVYGYARNAADAADITQETFVKVWKNLKKFQGEKNFRAWIFTIARNTALDWLRRKKTVPFSALAKQGRENPLLENLADPAPLLSEVFDNSVLGQKLTAALNKLLPKYRQVLTLYHWGGLNFRAIAQASGESINTVKSRYRRALEKLKKLLVN